MEVNLRDALKQARALMDDPQSGVLSIQRCDVCDAPTFAVRGYSSDGVNPYGSCLACGGVLTATEVEVGALSRSLLSSRKRLS